MSAVRAGPGLKLSLFAFLILIATGLRFGDYLHDHSLNHDEAADAVNLIHRSYAGLRKPLDFWVVAPIGFLYVEKAAGQLFGYSEFSLRLFPLLAGIALVPAFILIANDIFNWQTAFIGALILGTERRLIDWSARLKPYGLDAVLSLITLYLIYLGIRRGWTTRWLIIAALWGAIAQWFSFPMILLLAGMGAMAIAIALLQRRWRTASVLLCVCILWAISFALDRALAMNIGATKGHVDRLWDQYFMPHSLRAIFWIPWALTMIFSQTIRLSPWPVLPLILLIASCVLLWGRYRWIILLAISPIAPAFLAAAANKYPFGDRVLLYIAPLFVLIISAGLSELWKWRSVFFHLLAAVLLVTLVFLNLGLAATHLVSPPTQDETRPAYRYILDHHLPGDQIYVAFFAIPTFEYYAPRIGLNHIPADLGSGTDEHDLQADLAKLTGRVWLVSDLLNVPTTDESFRRLLQLSQQRGPELDHFKISHVEAHLFDLRAPVAMPQRPSSLPAMSGESLP